MAALFLSYKRENLTRVQPLVQALRANGVEVWWDQDIAPDAPWETTIERELAASKVVIVAWSNAAVVSENVKAEARNARSAGKLIQVFVEGCDPPLFFGERQGVDLSDWNGDAHDPRFQAVLAGARAVLEGKRPPSGVGYARTRRKPWISISIVVSFAAAALGFIANLGGTRDTMCSLSAIASSCVQFGLVAPNPAVTSQQTRQRLLDSVSGRWGRQDRGCGDAVTYSVLHGEDGFDRVTVSALNFESTGQVIAVENGVIISRTTTPSSEGAREQWELRPNGDQMTVTDKDGVSTTLVRCGE